jgi:hypothetical protein
MANKKYKNNIENYIKVLKKLPGKLTLLGRLKILVLFSVFITA